VSDWQSGRQIDNLLTFDIEDWYHANYAGVDLSAYRSNDSHFRANMDLLLQLCSDAGCKATFFVLGQIGEQYPEVVRDIIRAGHEVASHGYGHQLAYKQTYEEFRADVKKSADILQTLTGEKVWGYRAPSWSIMRSNHHFLQALEELGLHYDASIFPVKTFLYGIPDAPTKIHHPVVNGRKLELLEVPMSVWRIGGRNIGYSGGFYFRLFPSWLIKRIIRSGNRSGRHSIVYLHPREVDPTGKKLDLPLLESFIQYYNVAGTQAKLASILQSFQFTSIREKIICERNKLQ
jgi:polysaccharide deacetylase family protein (PEP-CTERM system associated)